MKKISIISVLLCISAYSLYSQNKIIEGRVISEHLDVLPGVSIVVNDTIEVGRADINGFFQIEIPVSQNQITFRFLGLEPLTIDLIDECDNLEVVMMYLYSYDFMSLRRA